MIGGADIRSLCGASYLLGGASRRERPQRGFSLIELMIGLVLVAVLMGIGLPLFRDFILNQRLRATSSDLRIALTLARSEAVKRNRDVKLRPTNADDGWSKGWIIPIPPDPDPDDPDVPAIIKHVQAGAVEITGPAEVTFTPAGRAKVPPGSVQFQIDVDPEDNDDNDDNRPDELRFACLERQLDGRVHSCRQACPNPVAPLPDPCDA